MQSRRKLHSTPSFAVEGQRKPAREGRPLRIEPLYETASKAEPRPAAGRRRLRASSSKKSAARRRAARAVSNSEFSIQRLRFDSLSQLEHLRTARRPPLPSQLQTPSPNALSAPAPVLLPSREWVSETEIAQQRVGGQMSQTIHLATARTIPTSAYATPARRSPSQLARLKALMQTFIRRLVAFLFPKKAARNTARGMQALTQLQSLADLLGAEFEGGGMDLVAYRAAFGEAYYNVLQASREHYRRHGGKQPEAENYQPYFEDFLRQLP